MKKIITICICLLFAFCCAIYNIDEDYNKNNYNTSPGNIQNGGYIVKYNNNYIYANGDADNNLYKSAVYKKNAKKISGGHFFYETNLCNDEIYYVSSYPGEIWKISVDGLSKKKLVNKKAGNLIIYNNYMFYRQSEDDNWGKLYRANLNGNNKKLLANKVKNFCIHNNIIYYFDLEREKLCSMDIDGNNVTVINNSYTNNIFIIKNMLIYSDHNREDKLYAYDLKSNGEYCISNDICWDINGNSDWVFYRNQSDGGSLYCVSYDGADKHKLIDKNITDIVIIDKDVFYRNIDKQNKIEYFNLNDIIK